METGLIPALNTSIVSIAEAAPAPYVLPDLPNTLSLRPVRIIENQNPFHVEERRVIEIAPLDNESAAALVTRAEIHLDDYKCSRNGSLIPDAELWSTAVEPGDELVLFPRAAGGRVWEMISMVALLTLVACFTGVGVGFAGFAAEMGISATAAGWIGAAAMMAGSMLISWAFQPGQPSSPSWSSTYDPTGPKGLAQPGVPVPKAYGTMGWCGNVISSYVNFDGKDAYINCLVCYGWGQAKSITNVLINQQPISVFSNASYQVRLGTNNQAPIDGFDRTTNGYPQEIEMLISNGPIVVQGTGTNVQGLDITVKFPSGLYRITGDGNDVPLKVIYKIEVSPHNQNQWTSPLFPNNTQTVATTHSNGMQTWPAWVVVPTDRFAGSGIVYASDNGTHTPGDLWSNTETVSTINVDGSTSNTSATFKGEWQPCDPNLNQALVTNWWQGYRVVENCTFSAFFDTVSVYGLTAGQWDVRITKTAWEWDNNHYIFYSDATSSQTVCDCWLWNINEIFWSNLSYPNMILVGVKALATSQLNGGSIQLMATITHDIGADTVIPAQLSAYEHDNPAIVAYDMLTNPLYGMGIAANMIDVPAFAAWAAFNDQMVTNQDGSQVRRHIFSGTFDQAGDAWHALGVIGGMSRASIIQLGMRYSVILDAPGDPVQLFTVGNTKRDSFTEAWVALDDRCTLIEVDFADAARNYRMDLPVSVMTEADINSGLQPKITRTKLTGCTSRDQAWRWAYFHLMSTKLTLRTIQFSAPVEAVCCSLGSVIAMQSDVVQWAVGGRVQAGSTLNTLSVDRTDLTFATASGWTVSVQHPVVQRGTAQVQSVSGLNVTMTAALPAGRIVKAVDAPGNEYIVTAYSGSTITLSGSTGSLAAGNVLTLYDANVIDNMSVVAVAVTPGLGAVISISGQFSAMPSKDSAWAYGQSAGAQPAKLFRVVSLKKSGDFAFDIGAMEYNPIIYTDVVPNYGEIVGVPNSAPAILNLSLTEQFQNGMLTGSSTSAIVGIGWMNSNTAVGAQVQVQATNGAWNVLGNIQGQGCTFTGTIGTTYNVSVTGFDWQGNLLGQPATASITVEASTNAPANVAGFTAASSSGGTVLTWSAVTGADHYEIRCAPQAISATWMSAEVLWDGTGTTWTDTTIRTGVYMIVAVSSLATGSIQSIAPTISGVGSNFNSASLSAILSTGTFGIVSGKLQFTLPAGTVYDLNGTGVPVAAQNIVYSGIPSPLATYYSYIYLDSAMTLHAAPDPATSTLPDTAPSSTDSQTALNAGITMLMSIYTVNSGGTGGAGLVLPGCTVRGTELQTEG
jgi:predicted phage tail protein